MENKFIINDDERQRILSLHENSTKQHYLNILNEQDGGNYTTKMDVKLKGGNGYIIPKNTVFKILKKNVLTAQVPGTVNGMKYFNVSSLNINFYCSQGKYYLSAGPDKSGYYDDGSLSGNLVKNLCNKQSVPQGGYVIQNPHTLNKGGIKIVKGDVAVKAGNLIQIKRGNTPLTSLDCTTGKFNTKTAGQVDADGGNSLRDNLMKQFCGKTLPATNVTNVINKLGGKVVIPKDIDLSQITKSLPPELQSVITPPTIDGQPNTGGQPDFNQLLTQLQGIS
jgi:hypothetical protein